MARKSILQRKYYGILRYSYTENKPKRDIFSLIETQGDCCCAENGIKLFESKSEALAEMRDNEMPDLLVEFTSKIIKK